ncbi:MAG: MTH938/NDUFAF3 family protein [Candidatus Pacearchaeota archaeon]
MEAYINKTEFGSITVNKKTYEHDIFIFANGEISERSRELSKIKYGTGHYFCKEEIENLLSKGRPEIIVFGIGQEGCAQLEEGAIELLKRLKIKYKIAKTPEAIRIFNQIKEKKAGLFHVTC